MKLQTYHRQNRLQKELMGFIRLFRMDQDYKYKLKESGIGVFTPKNHKYKLGLASIVTAVSLSTPGTNALGYFAVRRIMR
jgi:hypothetical protein